MDCLDAQSVISSSLDREPVEDAVLAQAKEHCRECPACSAFVRTLLVIRHSPVPAAPDDLADRVMAAVRAEATAQADADAQAAAAQADPETTPAPQPSEPDEDDSAASRRLPSRTSLLMRLQHVRVPAWLGRPAAGWIMAAAVFLVAAGVLGVEGLRQMSGQQSRSTLSATSAEKGASQDAASPSVPSSASAAASVAGGVTEAASPPQAVTYNGIVYVNAGQATVARGTLKQVGFTTTALGETGSATRRTVFGDSDASHIYIADKKDQLYAFARVTRAYGGLTYALTSSELPAFGQWPALPTQIQPPQAPDGSPTFALVGTDNSGVRVFRLSSATITLGIAIAPGSPATDSAAGNPGWTWWEPIR
ncbi:MAG: hypothetical protein HGA39_06790 [Coriobacteriia bacterium]|nr:hypothetical protein [Coriobacteriia bacterium]